MSDQQQIVTGLENALKNLVKLIKAVQYYPPSHPSLKQSLHETARSLLDLIVDDDEFICSVRKDGFYLEDKPVGQDHGPALALAHRRLSCGLAPLHLGQHVGCARPF